jgi:hypothetical protein
MKKLTLVLICGAVSMAQHAFADQAAALAVLRQGCADDAQKFCANVQPGGGRILACLQQNKNSLSDKCKAAAQQAVALNNNSSTTGGAGASPASPAPATSASSQDAALAVLQKGCADDAQKFCANVQPGGGRILDCLDKNQSSLSDKCKRAAQQAAAMGDNSTPQPPPSHP